MSEGVENTRTNSEARFWADRWHILADALVFSGYANKDPEKYLKIKAQMLELAFRPPQAALIAFNLADFDTVSHCEVHPW